MYEYKAVVTNVVDGDTLDVNISLGFHLFAHIRMRLARINTPETYGVKRDSDEYRAGMKAKAYVIDNVELQDVLIRTEKTGKFGRWIAEVFYGEDFSINLNDELVSHGLAKRYMEK